MFPIFVLLFLEAREKALQINKDLRTKLNTLMDINEMYNSANAELTQSVSDLNDYLTATKVSVRGKDDKGANAE